MTFYLMNYEKDTDQLKINPFFRRQHGVLQNGKVKKQYTEVIVRF